MNNIVNLQARGRAPRQPEGLDLLLLAACVLLEADPLIGLALRGGLYLWRRHGL